ncbi:MAG TPA: FtsX-like permease family protein [Ktedonobacteraceae bacterium]|nr:FtsX-like permease family protein [Ktedonobacteraceae bacterium]
MSRSVSQVSRRPGRTGLAAFPSMVTLALWQLRQTWRLLLIVGAGMIAAVILVCAVPLYSQVTMSAGLRDALNASPLANAITITSSAPLVSQQAIGQVQQQLNQEMQSNLGPFINSTPQVSVQSQGININTFDQVQLIGASIPQVRSHVKLLQGQLPHDSAVEATPGACPAASGACPLEIAITPQAAQNLHIQIGSQLSANLVFDNSAALTQTTVTLPLQVVGIFEPLSQNDPYWYGASFARQPLSAKGSLYPSLVSNQAFITIFDRISRQVISKPGLASGTTLVGPVTLSEYYTFDTSHIDINRLDDLANGLNNVLADLSNKPVVPGYIEKTQSNGPSDLLDSYSNRIDVVRIPVQSVAYLIVGLVLFFVSLMTDLLVDRQSAAIAMLRSRGASHRQIFSSLIIQSIGAGIIALLVGPLLAILSAALLARLTLSAADQGVLNLITANPVPVALGLYLSALIAVGVAVLAMIVAIYRATRLDVLTLRREAARASNRPLWLRMGVDMLAGVVALTGYAFSVYITSPGILDDRTRVLILPPMTLVGATFLLLGCTLLFLRIFPFVLNFAANQAARSRSATPVLALAQMARAPRQSLRVILLLALAIAFAIFTLSFNASQANRIPQVVNYQVGADFSGTYPSNDRLATQSLAQQTSAFTHIPGVTAASIGYESSTRASESGVNLSMELRAVDTRTFASTAIWTAQDSSQSLSSLLPLLKAPPSQNVPAIVDTAAWNNLHLSIGSPFTLTDYSNTINFVAVAEVNYIPTVNDSAQTSGTNDYVPFGGVLVDYQTYAAATRGAGGANPIPTTVWLRTADDPASLASVRHALSTGSTALTGVNDRRAITTALLNDPLYLVLIGVLVIGSLTALVLALIGNLTVSWLSARSRQINFAVMRALGSTPPQIAGVLTWEQSLVYAIAIGLGVAFGVLLSFLVLPAFVFTTVTTSGSVNQFSTGEFYVVQNVPPIQMIIPGLLVSIALGILVAICLLAVGLMVRVVSRPSISMTLRFSED